VLGVVTMGTWAPFLTPPLPARTQYGFHEVLDTEAGWAKCNRHYWLRDWRSYAEFFFGELLSEPHSTKQHEDCVSWAMEIGPETMLLNDDGPIASATREETEALLRQVSCPVLVMHGQGDRCQPFERGERVAELTGGELLALASAGHLPQGQGARHCQPCDQGVRGPLPSREAGNTGRAHLDQAAEPAQAGALPLLAHRARARAPRPGHRR
jgi:pimeloyl-ACP methyl ester carboxylesterase